MYLVYTLKEITSALYPFECPPSTSRCRTCAQIHLIGYQSSPLRDIPCRLKLQYPEYDYEEQHHTREQGQPKYICSQFAYVELRYHGSHVGGRVLGVKPVAISVYVAIWKMSCLLEFSPSTPSTSWWISISLLAGDRLLLTSKLSGGVPNFGALPAQKPQQGRFCSGR